MSPQPNPTPQPPDPSAHRPELVLLLRRAEAGESAAQSELVARYSRRLAGFIRPIIQDADSVEDVTQMVFVKMFRRLPHLRDPARFEPWLFTLARNTGLDVLRRRRCRLVTVELDRRAHLVPDPHPPEATADIHAALACALGRLSPMDQRLVTAVVAGERYATIAAHNGLSVTAVKVRLCRVRPFLRACVGEMTATRRAGAG